MQALMIQSVKPPSEEKNEIVNAPPFRYGHPFPFPFLVQSLVRSKLIPHPILSCSER